MSSAVKGMYTRSTTFEGAEKVPLDAMKIAGTSGTPQYDKYNTWSSSLPRHTHVTPHNTTFSTSHTPSSADKRNSARREAELIQARGRISQLELELSKTQHAAKRARMEESPLREDNRDTRTISQELQRLHAVSYMNTVLNTCTSSQHCNGLICIVIA